LRRLAIDEHCLAEGELSRRVACEAASEPLSGEFA
jgi:hypothetical protein